MQPELKVFRLPHQRRELVQLRDVVRELQLVRNDSQDQKSRKVPLVPPEGGGEEQFAADISVRQEMVEVDDEGDKGRREPWPEVPKGLRAADGAGRTPTRAASPSAIEGSMRLDH